LHGEYSTKDYDKHYIYYCADERSNPKAGSSYRYLDNNIVFETAEEYAVWLKTFHGVEFKGFWPNQTVVFCYKRVEKLIPQNEYDALDLPTDTRFCNGVVDVKVHYDDTLRTVTEYRYTNDEPTLAEKRVNPYVLAR